MRIPLLDFDTWQEVWWSLTRNRLRTFLTAFGVYWGILMLTVLLGFGEGLQRGVTKNFSGLARNMVFVRPGTTLMPFAGRPPGRLIELTNDDVAAVKRLPSVHIVSPQLRLGAWNDGDNVHYGAKTGSFSVAGTTQHQLELDPLTLVSGRFINSVDFEQQRKVAVIGRRAHEVLFGEGEAVGHYIELRGVYFLVVGEHRSSRGGQQGEQLDNSIFVPLTTLQRSFNRVNRISGMAVAMKPDVPATDVEKIITGLLRQRHQVSPDDVEGLRSFNVAEEFAKFQGLFLGIRVFVWFVGVLTLLAGILGVSNIILITIKERTKELGIRKALGATPASIIGLVVTEAMVLTCAAGYVGITVGVALLEVASRVVATIPDAPLTQPGVDLRVVLLAAGVLMLGGLLAAIVPARHATRIQPIEALRAD